MENIIDILQNWGLFGLLVAAFTESFISPIFPDFLLIPLALAAPEKAIYYGVAATLASVIGGFVGYGIGKKIGLPAAQRLMPAKYLDKIQKTVQENATWAIILAAISPIPYKFVSITAGALGVRLPVFIIASCIGRAKRFLIEGIIIYYFGPAAITVLNRFSDNFLLISVMLVIAAIGVVIIVKRFKKPAAPVLETNE